MAYSLDHSGHHHDDDHHDVQSHNHAHGAAEEGRGHDHAAAEEVSLTGGLQEQRYSRAKDRATSGQANLTEAQANQRCVALFLDLPQERR